MQTLRSCTLVAMALRSPRLRTGTLFRFDALQHMLAFCRSRYPTAEIRSEEIDGDFVLVVRSSEGIDFESLIVHFEGEQTYAVMLPP
jgi:hypothetical protein